MTKKELIQKNFSYINDFCMLNKYDSGVNSLLTKFLQNILQIRRAPTQVEWELKLATLNNLALGNSDTANLIISTALEKGWVNFYPVKQQRQCSYNNIKQPQRQQLDLSNETF